MFETHPFAPSPDNPYCHICLTTHDYQGYVPPPPAPLITEPLVEIEKEEDKYCTICYNTFPASEFLEIDECKHLFCKECVVQYLDQLISTRKIMKLVCP
jgi:hypothetical protein